jgi:hypothetical protein
VQMLREEGLVREIVSEQTHAAEDTHTHYLTRLPHSTIYA